MSAERYQPRSGLSIPLITVLDRRGNLLEDEQRALVRHALQGADIIFAAGTTGEWNRMDNPRRQLACRLAVEECRRAGRGTEVWAGITAHTRADTLANLAYAIELGADAAVIAPLSVADLEDPVDFVTRGIGDFFERRGRRVAVFLYDNAGIAAPGKAPHMHTRDVKRMSEAPYVHGVKVTAGKQVLGNYTRAASHFKAHGEFGIYAGNPYLIFDLFAPASGPGGWTRQLWNRYWTRDSLPVGVVAGPANAQPREWQRAWQVARERNGPLMRRYQKVLGAYDDACTFARGGASYYPAIACLKATLAHRGVCSSDALAPGTPGLEEAERREFLARLERVERLAAELLEPGWLSEYEARPAAQDGLQHG